MWRWAAAAAAGFGLAAGTTALCAFHPHHRLVDAADLQVVHALDYMACCKVCAASLGCTVSVLVRQQCHLKRFDRPVTNRTLLPAPDAIVCVPATPMTAPRSGPASAYPPLPRPALSPNATFIAPDRLPTGFPRLSQPNPTLLGFAGVERDGFAAPALERVCLERPRAAPLPTNAWWVPAIRPRDPATPNYIFPIPYIYDLFEGGARVAYPFMITSPGSVRNVVNRHWTLTTTAPDAALDFCVRRYDALTATFRWRDPEKGEPVLEMPLAHGSPYATMRYFGVAPKLFTPQKPRAYHVDGKAQHCDGRPVAGHKFSLRLQDSDEEWQLYLPPGTPLECRPGVEAGLPSVVLTVPDAAFTGYLRLALSNNCTTGHVPPSPHCAKEGVAHANMEHYAEALDTGSNACPVGGAVAMESPGADLQCTLEWEVTRCWASSLFEASSLFMIALPHHVSRFEESFVDVLGAGGHRNTRGYLWPVLAPYNKWVLQFRRPSIGWAETPDAKRIPTLRAALHNESRFDLPPDVQWGYIDPYNAGKMLARLARLAVIAEKLGEPNISQAFTTKLTLYLSVWLDGKSANPLLYDKSWGGMVSCGCSFQWMEKEKRARCSNDAKQLDCPVLKDMNADFGNGHYNDHHFHYGYFLYAAAVATHLDPAWGRAYNERALLLLRDIANPDPEDPYFPAFRHFDWYLGHSWASGIVPGPNGKNQESTSEAVNAHFGVCLYGLATGHKPLSEMGELMMLMEAHASKYYWYGSGGTFPDGYGHDMAGIVHDMLFEFQTYFGSQTYFIHGIHVLPLTGATKYLLSPDWLETSLKAFDESCTADLFCHRSGFVTFNYASHAFLDKDEAWDLLLSLPDAGPGNVYDVGSGGGNGNSKTNSLFWCASVGNDEAAPQDYFEDLPGPVLRRRHRRWRHVVAALGAVLAGFAAVWHLQRRWPAEFARYVTDPAGRGYDAWLAPLIGALTTGCGGSVARAQGYDDLG